MPFKIQAKHPGYNAIFGRWILSLFRAVIHHNYLVMKVPSEIGVISVWTNQEEARKANAARYVNQAEWTVKQKPEQPTEPKAKVEPCCEATKISLWPSKPEKRKNSNYWSKPIRKWRIVNQLPQKERGCLHMVTTRHHRSEQTNNSAWGRGRGGMNRGPACSTGESYWGAEKKACCTG
jgi:hypothetical protein